MSAAWSGDDSGSPSSTRKTGQRHRRGEQGRHTAGVVEVPGVYQGNSSVTTTVKVVSALAGGVPSSVTRTVT